MQQLPYPFYVFDINGFHQTNPFTLSEGLSKHPREPIYRQPLKQHHKDFLYRIVRTNAIDIIMMWFLFLFQLQGITFLTIRPQIKGDITIPTDEFITKLRGICL